MAGLPRLLVVDDDADIRYLVATVSKVRSLFDVVGEAIDGGDAVRLARSLQPDAVLLDIFMPHRRGDDALPLIKAVSPHSVVAVFSAALSSDSELPLHGADLVARKSVPIGDVLARLHDAVRSRSLRRERHTD